MVRSLIKYTLDSLTKKKVCMAKRESSKGSRGTYLKSYVREPFTHFRKWASFALPSSKREWQCAGVAVCWSGSVLERLCSRVLEWFRKVVVKWRSYYFCAWLFFCTKRLAQLEVFFFLIWFGLNTFTIRYGVIVV